MRFPFAFSLAAFFAFLSTSAASQVITLTAVNFNSVVKHEPLIMVEFIASWCPHCQTLTPIYERAATNFQGTAKIAKIDCSKAPESEICKASGIQGYPYVAPRSRLA
ncbi:thioredoxin-like protein [Fomitopsis serialis]|uniref:thioredoxin-like protein n=1 Tax=Fomitopsis serialis TaxID=139415 RepID=UPI002007BDF7|nr:thioredoxin-like protein [Neoantrodia serialis]KAH9918325.1 thioredoxin-like protein [Neoantrodia serialis]